MLEQRVSLFYMHVTATNTHRVYLLWHGSNANRVVVADDFHLTFVSLCFFSEMLFYFSNLDLMLFHLILSKIRREQMQFIIHRNHILHLLLQM